MKKYLIAVGAMALMVAMSLVATEQRVRAGIICTLPNTLQNGTVADATQVMANFNAITACFLNNIAASGANNDITGLFALTTPIAPVNGGTPTYIGSNSGSSANAQVVATTTPANFTLSAGRSVRFVAGLTNTAAMTLNVASSGAVNVFKRTGSGIVATTGGEVVTNQVVVVTYDGTEWVLNQPSPKTVTTQTFASGSGTYTNPGALWIEILLVGAGGGGGGAPAGSAGSGGTGGDTCWNTTGAACTGPLYDAGGGTGGTVSTSVGGLGGAISGTGTCIWGTNGSDGSPVLGGFGGIGGASSRGGAGGATTTTGRAAAVNSGSGGGGGTPSSGTPGPGGASGATCYAIITAPAATYTYQIGVAGTAGTAGGGGFTGGAGGSGYILVTEHYQ